ncbi:NGG1p interacting factor 3 [Eremomyces bilateralis CBS 781.70]|uniref:NGG1p interacting factor 3 n=1 Tax=Eremomyces bilateralis CBS 781.70 TaxID=1392243 RepID=A0A6G1FTJ1_9PEZI|nr:NGG1p interacting factor 3 [Eremomyces bilateralis CBS 781.70]KAF1809002.1 NGG1p interacting factor 3 [Eremomyces bilateralis CBS 781.70]
MMSSQTAPFSKAVVSAMRKLYPERLADKSWDNTGLLLEAPYNPQRRQRNSALLTVDLTKAVADEAIETKQSIVVAYHPIIFKGLKALSLGDSQQQSLLRLATEGISVYCPHTAVDAASGGLGDWLADIVTGDAIEQPPQELLQGSPVEGPPSVPPGEETDPFVLPQRPSFILQPHPSGLKFIQRDLKLASIPHTRSAIKPNEDPSSPGAGMGRVVRFAQPQPLAHLIDRIARGLGQPKGFPVAIPQGTAIEDISIRSVGICAGSGGSLFAGLDVDLLFTGELSHHEALAAIERGQSVVTMFHSNTERGFLHSVLSNQLLQAVREEWETIRSGIREDGRLEEALKDTSVEVEVSERDRDPFGLVIAQSAGG